MDDTLWLSVPSNISSDPKFRSTATKVFSVRHCSPVMDMGADLRILSDETDIDQDGNGSERTPLDDARKHRIIAAFLSDPNCEGFVDQGAFESCEGDVDDNGTVGLPDLAILLACFGSTNCSTGCCRADMDCNDDVTLPDLSVVLTRFGAVCGAQEPCEPEGGGVASHARATTAATTQAMKSLRATTPSHNGCEHQRSTSFLNVIATACRIRQDG